MKKELLKISAEEICRAYNKHSHYLIAVESSCGCPGVSKKWSVANEMVVLRQLLQELGFSEEKINDSLHLR